MKVYVADYIGDKFGRLTIIADAGKSKNNSYKVLCKCDCGNTVETLLCRLLSGNTQSCGCLKSQLIAKRNAKHNLSNTHLYRIYRGIKNRCYNTKDLNYKKYGAKGILMADEWLGENGFHNFYTWANKNGYYYEKLPNGRSKLTIDRINNDKGYSPENQHSFVAYPMNYYPYFTKIMGKPCIFTSCVYNKGMNLSRRLML